MKRVIDISIVLAISPFAFILVGATALAVAFFLGHPLFFRQPRPGLHGAIFELLKFRTMTNATGPDGELLPDAERLTRFGLFLRSTSLDELPCLWNVLKGDLSLVGPRPLLVSYLPRYTVEQMRRHDVKPGITGWAQVNGRNTLSWDEKFALDLWYVDNRSVWLDFKILFLTAYKVIGRRDVAAEGHATMPVFMGSEGKH